MDPDLSLVNKAIQWLKRRKRVQWYVLALVVLLGLLGLSIQSGTIRFGQKDQTWLDMQERGSWRIGVDPSFPPFEYLDEDGQPIGFDLDLASKLASQWGMEVQVIPIGFDSLVDAVQTGQIDSVVSALPYDPRLTKDVNYSVPYFDAGTLVAVRASSTLTSSLSGSNTAVALDAFSSPEEAAQVLAGKRIGVEWGGMGDMLGRRYQREVDDIELMPFATQIEAVEALQQDPSIDGVLIDNITLHQMQAGADIVGVGPLLESNPYVIATPIEATELAEQIDNALNALIQEGAIEQLAQTWFQKQ